MNFVKYTSVEGNKTIICDIIIETINVNVQISNLKGSHTMKQNK